eukprot:COSAG05_NODE_2119_length_3535_cov_3.409779_1_plen_158_part_00
MNTPLCCGAILHTHAIDKGTVRARKVSVTPFSGDDVFAHNSRCRKVWNASGKTKALNNKWTKAEHYACLGATQTVRSDNCSGAVFGSEGKIICPACYKAKLTIDRALRLTKKGKAQQIVTPEVTLYRYYSVDTENEMYAAGLPTQYGKMSEDISEKF